MLDTGEINQLTALLLIATLLFLLASALPQKVATIALLVLVPFQAVETRFGSSSMLIAYVVFIAMLLRRERVRLPMLPQILFLLLWYAVSMALMHPSTYIHHAIYMYTLVSAFLVFWLGYDLTHRLQKETSIVNVFIVMNVLVVIYCAVQVVLGPGQGFEAFGISELGMYRARDDEEAGRLTGPFQSALATGQYLVMMQFVILHQFWYTRGTWARRGLILLAALNIAALVGTGSRGDTLLLLGGSALYLWLFRQRLGTMRAIKLALSATIVLTAVGLLMLNFSQFGGLLQRFESTEFTEQGIPDTREVAWRAVWPKIVESPVIGHGPQMVFWLEQQGAVYPHHEYLPYPHSLYLFLLYTVGVPGLLLFSWVLIAMGLRCWRAMAMPNAPPYFADLARTGVLLIVLFFIAGLKHEQMRLPFADLWYFWFGLCGVLMAACNRVEQASRAEVSQPVRQAGSATGRPRKVAPVAGPVAQRRVSTTLTGPREQ